MQALLSDLGWEYDVFLCHAGDDKPYVEKVYQKMKERRLKAFYDKVCLKKGDKVQRTVAEAIIRSPFFVVVLSKDFLNMQYSEAEVKAALAFPEENKTIIPVFYKITADESHDLTRKMYCRLADTTGYNRESKTEEEFAEEICKGMEQMAKHQQSSSISQPCTAM